MSDRSRNPGESPDDGWTFHVVHGEAWAMMVTPPTPPRRVAAGPPRDHAAEEVDEDALEEWDMFGTVDDDTEVDG